MRLVIKRGQKEERGLLGGTKGVTFKLSCQVQISKEEYQLVNKYQAGSYILKNYKRDDNKLLTISNLLHGVNYELKDVTTLIEREAIIKQACEEFKILLTVMASFGGEEVIEF